jgi:hypothetical protein
MGRGVIFAALALWSTALGAATFTVTNNADSGAGSLRQAIDDANAAAGADTIVFAIGSGPQTINIIIGRLSITDSVLIDGQTQPGFAGAPLPLWIAVAWPPPAAQHANEGDTRELRRQGCGWWRGEVRIRVSRRLSEFSVLFITHPKQFGGVA